MSGDTPITEKITRRVFGRWGGYLMGSIYKAPVWTVGKLEQICAEMRAAGYDENTELSPKVAQGDAGLTLDAFIFERFERVSAETPVTR